MFKRLKNRFILLSMLSLALLMIVVVTGMNILNYASMQRDTDAVLDLLSANEGRFPTDDGDAPPERPEGEEEGRGDKLPHGMSPETPYESRYFTVELSADRTVLRVDTSRIAAVGGGEAIEYASKAMEEKDERGYLDNYRFLRMAKEDGGTRLIFLDVGRKAESLHIFLLSSISMAAVGYILICMLVVFVAGRIIRPVAESYEKQKRFITDAGHEIKTPLSIINANVNLLEMEGCESESLSEISKQTRRLSKLTGDLVFLAKMEEGEGQTRAIDFPLSEMISDAVESFGALAETSGKKLEARIEPMISVHGNSDALYQLVNILLENALKYSVEGSTISVFLEKKGRSAVLRVANETDTPIGKEDLPLLFERFYRTDSSRNSATGGHGIGLSIAKAIVDAHGGRIYAALQGERVLQISAELPT